MSNFGHLLLCYRRAAGLTQEELAQAAGVSARAVRNLERGHARAAQRRQAEVLADALRLIGDERQGFLTAAADGRRRANRPEPTANVALCAPPMAVPDFVGREAELAQLTSWARGAAESPGGTTVSIVGPGGIGKTSLAVAALHRLAPGFPDGCLAVDLRGMDERPVPAGTALNRMLRALGLPEGQLPAALEEQSSVFRSMLRGRRVLVLLDNAAEEVQVRPLLATAAGCHTLITCRHSLSGLEGVRWMWLDPLPTGACVELLSSIADPARVQADLGAAAELAQLCGNLPLAVRIVGNRLARQSQWSVAQVTAQLRDEHTRLTSLTAGDLQVRPAFTVSYDRLSTPAQRLFRHLALVPGTDFGLESAAAAAGTPQAETQLHLEELIDTTLLQLAPTPGRYQFHDLIRIFARERLEAEEDSPQRLADDMYAYVIKTATEAARLHHIDSTASAAAREKAAAWLEHEASAWVAAARYAADTGWHRELIDLIRALHWFSDTHQQFPWTELFTRAMGAARALGDRHDEAALLNFLAWAHYLLNEDRPRAVATAQQALAIAEDIGDKLEEAWALLYMSRALMYMARPEEALAPNIRATALFAELNYGQITGARNTQGRILRMLGRHDEALAAHRAALADLETWDDQMTPDLLQYYRGVSLMFVAEVLFEMKDWPAAAATFQSARSHLSTDDQPHVAGEAALYEGVARRHCQEHAEAVACLREALTLFSEAATPAWCERTLTELAATLTAKGDLEEAAECRRAAAALAIERGRPGPAL
ncbi:MAG TPA: NB-ARC domain-containing protein [Streptosporangiaceae bacterium]|nr:NB-ARC domain-containing protein [Streptosporangiaceae bacterium]